MRADLQWMNVWMYSIAPTRSREIDWKYTSLQTAHRLWIVFHVCNVYISMQMAIRVTHCYWNDSTQETDRCWSSLCVHAVMQRVFVNLSIYLNLYVIELFCVNKPTYVHNARECISSSGRSVRYNWWSSGIERTGYIYYLAIMAN